MRLLVALLWCRLAAPHANVTTVHLSIPFEDGARTLVWRRAAESAKEACARFAAEQGLNGDVLPDLEALVASQTALRKVSPSLFAAPSWWRPAEAAGTIAFFGGHDASVAVAAADGTLLCVLELERLFNDRYYSSFGPDGATPRESFDEDWRRALLVIRDRSECAYPRTFARGIVVETGASRYRLEKLVEEVFDVETWLACDHHEAHARLGFFASPFASALIVSYDGGGNDGHFNVYVGRRNQLERVGRLDYSLGQTYLTVGSLLREVTNDQASPTLRDFCAFAKGEKPTFSWNAHPKPLALAGKLMGYAATGSVRDDLRAAARALLLAKPADLWRDEHRNGVSRALADAVCGEDIEGGRDFAATAQNEYEGFVLEVVSTLLERAGGPGAVDGVVLAGGCGLNVRANQRVFDELGAAVYVAPAPNDAGLAAGAAWKVTPPPRRPARPQHLGFGLWDGPDLADAAAARGARNLTELGGVEYLAALLNGAHTSGAKPIVAVVRGRQEFGPRALGRRSLLAVPDSVDARNRLNRLKRRQWYRPVAPMVAEEAMADAFGRSVPSPYMTMAPDVSPPIARAFPALAHLDGTARHQSVARRDDAWLHALLRAVGKRTGLAALINTSFNTRGKPICNTLKEALTMLDEEPDLDYLLVDDWLFAKSATPGGGREL